jgi:hypothetical protein
VRFPRGFHRGGGRAGPESAETGPMSGSGARDQPLTVHPAAAGSQPSVVGSALGTLLFDLLDRRPAAPRNPDERRAAPRSAGMRARSSRAAPRPRRGPASARSERPSLAVLRIERLLETLPGPPLDLRSLSSHQPSLAKARARRGGSALQLRAARRPLEELAARSDESGREIQFPQTLVGKTVGVARPLPPSHRPPGARSPPEQPSGGRCDRPDRGPHPLRRPSVLSHGSRTITWGMDETLYRLRRASCVS